MKLQDCHNFDDFRILAKKKLPSPIFHYIDGAADDEITYRRNTSSFNDVDLVPNVLRGVDSVDLSTTIFGKKLTFLYIAPRLVCKDYFIMMEKELWEKQLRNLILCLGFQHYQQ